MVAHPQEEMAGWLKAMGPLLEDRELEPIDISKYLEESILQSMLTQS